jgi:hypothetical protein
VNIDWDATGSRIGKACVWSIVTAIVVYELASHAFVWWILKTEPHPDGQLGLGGWLVGITAGAVASVVAFCAALYVPTLGRRKPDALD